MVLLSILRTLFDREISQKVGLTSSTGLLFILNFLFWFGLVFYFLGAGSITLTVMHFKWLLENLFLLPNHTLPFFLENFV